MPTKAEPEIITDPSALANLLEKDLNDCKPDIGGYPICMTELHADEWRVVIGSLRTQALAAPPRRLSKET